jgi:hypothetical protein
MITNRVSATLSTADQEAVISAIEVIEQKLPFLIDLATAERVQMAKLGDKTEAFVRKAVEIASQHSGLLSETLLGELVKDAELRAALGPIQLAIDRLQKRVDDTVTQLGAEAYAAARTVYAVSKTPFAEAALRTATGDLSKRFGRRQRVAPAPEPAPPPKPEA